MCSPIRQLIISNEKVAKVGLRVHNVRMSGPRNIDPYVQIDGLCRCYASRQSGDALTGTN